MNDSIYTVVASYRQAELPEYRGNPLIEALPNILSQDESSKLLCQTIHFDKAERDLPAHIRLHCIKRLENLVVALPLHIQFESELSILFRGGYVSRNPCDPKTWQAMMSRATNQDVSPIPMPDFYRSSAASLLLTGLSGIGKSTMLEIILRTYPQIIRHSNYDGKPFDHTQIVWLKIDCPHDGSLKGLCREFFKAVDKLTETTDYEKQWGGDRVSVEKMQSAMETIASTYFIGMLVIDELQHLSIAKAGGSDKMMNFYVNLINKINVPIVLTGTYKVKEIFAKQMRQARRASDKGTIDFGRFMKGDPVWDMLVKAVWKYQWVKNPAKLIDPIKERIYDLTQGVTALLVGLLAMAQSMAIADEHETVDAGLLQKVYDERMQLLHPAINALRSGKPKKMGEFDDLLPTDFDPFDAKHFDPRDADSILALLTKRQEESELLGDNSVTFSPKIEPEAVVVPENILDDDIRRGTDAKQIAELTKLGIVSQNPMTFGQK